MATINKPYTYSANTTISASQVNANEDTIYNEFNGNISAANIASNAITTAKISDSNVTTAKIADSNVTTAKIADDAVTPAKWTNPYCFRAYNSVSVTLTDATNVKITLGAEEYDYNNNFNTTTSTYTVPVAGIYHFDCKVKITGAVSTGAVFTTFLYVNGANTYEGNVIIPGNFAAVGFGTDVLLAANDTIELYAQQDSAGNEATATGSGATWLSGHLVHAI